ncbi:MAG: tetratricopeptide repeat protein [Hydrogenophilales bacterium]|nr:tetratricopeptide repeat protein [Hydrogenophilales bacterium]
MNSIAQKRLLLLALAVFAAGGIGFVLSARSVAPDKPAAVSALPADPNRDPALHARQARSVEIDVRFKQAAAMLHAQQYEHAATALHRVLELAPGMPEAHVNMGFAMIGVKRYAAARDFFEAALNLRPAQLNAYYGLAEALEGLNDLEGALGAMRSYIHRSSPDEPYVRKARAAIWEWEMALKRKSNKDFPKTGK